MCEQVSVGVCDWGWFAPAESHHRWAISVPVTLSPLSDPCSVCGRRLRSVLVPRFLSPAASWTPITGPLAAHCFPALPASALRRAPFLPTESSASALRRAPFLSTKSSTFSSRCVLLLVINSLFRNWILPSSLWHYQCANSCRHCQVCRWEKDKPKWPYAKFQQLFLLH